MQEKGNRQVAYAEKAEITKGIMRKCHPEDGKDDELPSEAVPGGGTQTAERNEPVDRSKTKGGSSGSIHTGPRAKPMELRESPAVPRSPKQKHPPKPEVKSNGQT